VSDAVEVKEANQYWHAVGQLVDAEIAAGAIEKIAPPQPAARRASDDQAGGDGDGAGANAVAVEAGQGRAAAVLPICDRPRAEALGERSALVPQDA